MYLCRLVLWKQLFIIVLFIYLCRLLLRKEYNLSENKRYRNHNMLNLLVVRQVPLLLFVTDVWEVSASRSFCTNLFQCLVKLFCLFLLGILKIIIFLAQFVFFFAHFRNDVVWRLWDLGWRAIFIHNSAFFFSLLFPFFSSFSLFWNLFVLVFNKFATQSKADSSSVYPMERKFAWRAANSFFKFPSNFLHSHKIFPFICRETFLSSLFTNGAILCISKGWTRGSTSSERPPGSNHLQSQC